MQPNWGDTYVLVDRMTTFCYLISMAASHGLAIDHLDVVTAFLNPEVDDPDLYMEVPVGWDDGSHDSEIAAGTVVRLKKALYGLKQAPRPWYGDTSNFLLLLGFTQSKADPNLYTFGDITSIGDITNISGRPLTLLLLYVDDIHGISKQRNGNSQKHQSQASGQIQDHELGLCTPIPRNRNPTRRRRD